MMRLMIMTDTEKAGRGSPEPSNNINAETSLHENTRVWEELNRSEDTSLIMGTLTGDISRTPGMFKAHSKINYLH